MRAEIQRVYVALWHAGADVCYPPEERLATGGKFYDGDKIDIYRLNAVDSLRFEPHWHRSDGTRLTDDELLEELFALAHEYGHMRSNQAGTWAPQKEALERFQEATRAGRAVARADYVAVVDEERRAWTYARAILESLNWSLWAPFDDAASRLLKTYEDVPQAG